MPLRETRSRLELRAISGADVRKTPKNRINSLAQKIFTSPLLTAGYSEDVNAWEHLAYRKKAEFWIRLSRASETLFPGDDASLFDRIVYRRLSQLLQKLFLRFAHEEIATERMKMNQEDCKHDKAAVDATFCPDCGKQLGADPDVEQTIGRVVRKILSEYDVKPKPVPKGGKTVEPAKSLAEKLGLNKKKEPPK